MRSRKRVNRSTLLINNSLHLARKYARIFVRGHYLFRVANSFRERSSRKTVSYEEQIMSKDKYPSIFSPQMEAIVFIILQIFYATRAVLKIGEYPRIFPSFSWGIFAHVTRLDQSRASENIWWIIMLDNIEDTPWLNNLSSRRKLKTWVYLLFRLARPCAHLPWLAITLVNIKLERKSMQSFHRLAKQPKSTQVEQCPFYVKTIYFNTG